MRYLILISLFFFTLSAQARLEVGTVLIFSNGDVEKLIAYQGSNSLWENSKKDRYLRSSNPVIPALSRSVFADPEAGYRQKLINGRPDLLKSGKPGQYTSLFFRRYYDDGRVRKRRWTCAYHGETIAKVIKEMKPVERYSCMRYTRIKPASVQVIRERRTIDYDPDLGIVANADIRKGEQGEKNRSRNLVLILSPEKATAGRIQRTLYKMFN